MGTVIEKDQEPQHLSDRKKLFRLLREALRYRREASIVIVSIGVGTAVAMVGPLLIGFAINALIAKQFSHAVDFGLLYAALYGVNYFADNRRTFLMPVVSQSVIRNMRDRGFESLQRVPISYFSKRETGRIMSYIMNDAEALSDFLTFQLPQVLSGIAAIAGSIVIMLYYDVPLTLVSLTVIPMLGGFALIMQKRIRENFMETRRKIAVVTARLQETISGVRVIQAFAREDAWANRFDQANQDNMRVNLRATKLTSLFNSTVQIVEAFGIAIVLYVGAGQVLSGALSVGLLASFIFWVQQFFNPVLQLSTFYNSYQAAMVGLDRVYRLVDAEPQEPKDLKLQEAGEIKGEVEFRDVRFAYDRREVLHGISFVIPAGAKVALVGPTGAGKTTITNMLLKFYQPSSGAILIDGRPLSEIDTSSYRNNVGVVLQESLLLSGTVLENIRFGNPDLTDGQIVQAIRGTDLDKMIRTLPNGYNTVLRERGSNLSEGQKQLISFARAIVRNPRILILDEATSQLDPMTERSLQHAMSKTLEGRTSVIIAHRLSTVSLCDLVLVVEDGRITQSGPPDSLIRQPGTFAKLYALQTQV
jgi:ATP-binding cassette subfamily B protein